MSSVYFQTQLPWSSSEQENKRFTKITYGCLAIALMVALLVQWVQVPQQTREEKESIPPQLARILKAKPLPPPPVVKPTPKVEPIVEEKKPVPKKPDEPVKPLPKQVPEPVPVPKQITKEEKVAQARENAKQTGLLAFSDDLASMRNDINLANVANTETIEGAGQQEQTSRKRIGQETLTASSGSLKNANISQNIGARGELEGRRNTEFNAPEEGVASLAAKRIEVESQVLGDRDLESIRKVLDANKGAVYALYRRALRQNPDLEGKVTVNLTIEPNGSLSAVALVSSELENVELEKKLLARIRMINFNQANVQQTQLEYAFNFLPF
ncbi:AgmX/PglI C-terminal domain-containing protein [Alteromonas sp. 1_MG-2023]|uniref:AgmX/PglI C-terminal domain-containing protein n=1 Tax=Alteromonas sp. 1_MG-2023 TaxID=3062669 RepID=UPI0026E3EC48|nr:AgmX/PglI C-terminal domain-containing protein [Alteromonas sp. 1_MG-2023]MDO6565573.1 AgmX/PglI C-terminal domain-containing protein [Alteromonas sp. 1_MG-2023]